MSVVDSKCFLKTRSRGIAVNLLNEEVIATAYAMTIHKSQGSEFDHVAITFDNSHARLLSKELIYTAVTGAKKQVTIYQYEIRFGKGRPNTHWAPYGFGIAILIATDYNQSNKQ